MSPEPSDARGMQVRPFDVVLYGATGYTGGLCAEVLARHPGIAPARWALAGRDEAKLRAVRARLAAIDPALARLELIFADARDPASLVAMAERARVVATTVGPYARYGEALISACIEAGAHYVDLTGEPRWWRAMIERHHERAQARRVAIVPCCGFDSIPHDLGALFVVRRLPKADRIDVRGYLSGRGGLSGGTLASAIDVLGERPWRRGAGRRGRAQARRAADAREPRDRPLSWVSELGVWALPMPTIDPLVVARSAQLRADYAADFSYRAYLAVPTLPHAGLVLGVVGAFAAAAKLEPLRPLLQRLRPQGQGPSPEQRAKSWFCLTVIGNAAGRRVTAEVRGGDPGYGETAKMFVESALCLAQDWIELPGRAGGVLTPASAMGERLIERLQAVGIGFSVVERTEG